MPTWSIILIISLLALVVISQIVFVIIILKKVNNERTSLITLHREHLDIIVEQRNTYKDLLDELIEQHIIGNGNDQDQEK